MIDFAKLSRQRTLLAALAASALLLAVPPAVSARVRLTIAEIFEPVHLGGPEPGPRGPAAPGGLRAGARAPSASCRRSARRTNGSASSWPRPATRSPGASAASGVGLAAAALERAEWRRGVPVAANVVRRPGRWESLELFVDRGTASGAAAARR